MQPSLLYCINAYYNSAVCISWNQWYSATLHSSHHHHHLHDPSVMLWRIKTLIAYGMLFERWMSGVPVNTLNTCTTFVLDSHRWSFSWVVLLLSTKTYRTVTTIFKIRWWACAGIELCWVPVFTEPGKQPPPPHTHHRIEYLKCTCILSNKHPHPHMHTHTHICTHNTELGT